MDVREAARPAAGREHSSPSKAASPKKRVSICLVLAFAVPQQQDRLPVTPAPEVPGLGASQSPTAQAETTPAAVCGGPVEPLRPGCLPLGRMAQTEGKEAEGWV